MKPRAFKSFVAAVLAVSLAASLTAGWTQAADSPAPSPAKNANGKGKGKPKAPKDTGDPTLPPKERKAKEIPFPVPVGQPANNVRIPDYNKLGELNSVMSALNANHIDADHVQLKEMKLDLKGNDGKEAYFVEMPTSVLNLKTNVIVSEHPVTIRTKDFELTGEKAEFNTVERSGELRGHVQMRIHNLKQVATPGVPGQATPDPQ